MSELIRKLKEKKFITKVKVKDDLTDELLSKEIPQTGSIKIVEEVKKEIGPVKPPYAVMRETNPELMDVCVVNGWAANNDYMTYEEAAGLTYDMIKPKDGYYWPDEGSSLFASVTHFEEFQYFTGVTTLSIHNGEAPWPIFYDADLLTSIILPENITVLDNSAFEKCTSLKYITFSPKTTSFVTSYNHPLKDTLFWKENYIDQPDGVIYFGSVLYQYKGTAPENTTIKIKDGTTSICTDAFRDQTNIIDIETPNSVTTFGDGIIYNTGYYNNHPDGVVYLGPLASGYKGVMPENTTIKIKDGTTEIASGTFKYKDNLISVEIPNTVKRIGSYTFSGCYYLHEIICHSIIAPDLEVNCFGYTDDEGCDYYTGQNTKPNVLKVPTGATGYDTGAWYDILQNSSKCGFVIEYI